MNEQLFAVFLACVTVLALLIVGATQDAWTEQQLAIKAMGMAEILIAETMRRYIEDPYDQITFQTQFVCSGTNAVRANIRVEECVTRVSLSVYGVADRKTRIVTNRLGWYLSQRGVQVQTFFHH